MSYISAILKNNDVLVWERTEDGQRVEKFYKPPYYFYITDENGKYTTIYDTKVSKCEYDNSFEFYKAKKKFEEQNVEMWESDISAELRVLSYHYYNKPAPNLNITFLDIENDYDINVGYAKVSNPYAPINSVSLYHYYNKKMVVICVPPFDNKDGWTAENLEKECNAKLQIPDTYHTEFVVCKNEKELLLNLLAEIQDSDLLCGWNSEIFDMPYITKRVELVLGKSGLRKLSFPGGELPKYKEIERFDKMHTAVDLSGRLHADYMDLYKKYEQNERESYSLEAISNIVIVDEDEKPLLPKLEYEGSLYRLYREDFAFFVRYNIRDCEILEGFERILGYVGVANLNYHLSCGLFHHVLGTLKLAELALVNFCHHEKKRVVNNIRAPKEDKSISGALVLYPHVGMHEQMGSVDIGSLYPNILRSINGSPEKIVGQFVETEKAFQAISNNIHAELTLELDVTEEQITKTTEQWIEWLLQKNYAISGWGTVFDQNSVGFIPSILTDWIVMRKKYQGIKKDYEAQLKTIKKSGCKTATKNVRDGIYLTDEQTIEYDKIHQQVEYYDRLQYVFKIKLNSLYGALNNLWFRFNDSRLGESTTCSGRAVVKHQARKVNETLGGEYNVDFPTYANVKMALKAGHGPETALDGPHFNGKHQTDIVLYGDTDSCYFKTGADNTEDSIKIADRIAEIVNDSFPEFMEKTFLCGKDYRSFIKTGREIVSDRGIFVEKKRYILHIVDVEGKRCDKMKVMGLDTKKTTLPKLVADKINNLVGEFLKGDSWENISVKVVEFKEWLTTESPIFEIGLPKGVGGVEEYTEKFEANPKTNLPGGAAAAIHYNLCLKQFDDKENIPIVSGMKMKVFILKQKHGRFKTIALPTDIHCVPAWFYENFKVDIPEHLTRLVDNPLQNIVKAIGKRAPSRQTLLVDSVLEF